jgi:hypothetical protein
MPRLTNEEYAALDEKWTQETPAVNFSRIGMFARQRLLHESRIGRNDNRHKSNISRKNVPRRGDN